MARSPIAIALVTTTLVLLLVFQLLSHFGFPKFQYFHWTYGSFSNFPVSHQVPIISLGGEGSEAFASDNGTEYLLGVGKADITGPVVEINLMGYADPKQVGSGLRQRLYSRAFIIADIDRLQDRFIYLVLDIQSGDTAVRDGILRGLEALGAEYAAYSTNNLAVTGTHSHSGPGAWLNYLLPQITSMGFLKQSYQAIVDGALLSIQRAHQSLEPGYLSFGSIEVDDANVNRSPFAYLANPQSERERYQYDVDKTLTMLRFRSARSGKGVGVLTWFPVHGTSMLGNNSLVSGDNKGVAAYLFEKEMQSSGLLDGDFVAGFAQSNVGDTSPNVLGAYCEDEDGGKCNFKDSTCNGRNEPCHGRGPFFRIKDQGASSCFEIGRRQYSHAKALFDSLDAHGIPIKGPVVRSLHAFHDYANFTFQHPNGSTVSTCPAALGYSFAAGTTDGPGAFDFKQHNPGAPNANPLWSMVCAFLRKPSDSQKRCHYPKPILLDVGEMKKPYLWSPNLVDIQLLRVGQVIIIVSPGEATTMAGRRWKESLAVAASSSSLTEDDPIVVLGGPANSYTHYIATEEEYNVQRYEGASTLYGPHTLNAYINLTTSYLPYLHSNAPYLTSTPEPSPPIYTNTSLSFIRGVLYDRAPFFKKFGDVINDVKTAYQPGHAARVTFVGANPRNDLRLEQTYALVEVRDGSGRWHPVRDDSDWSLIFEWRRVNSMLGTSETTITWEIEPDIDVGRVYRIKYFGAAKQPVTEKITSFEGVSGIFRI